jgi:hypothetical protein
LIAVDMDDQGLALDGGKRVQTWDSGFKWVWSAYRAYPHPEDQLRTIWSAVWLLAGFMKAQMEFHKLPPARLMVEGEIEGITFCQFEAFHEDQMARTPSEHTVRVVHVRDPERLRWAGHTKIMPAPGSEYLAPYIIAQLRFVEALKKYGEHNIPEVILYRIRDNVPGTALGIPEWNIFAPLGQVSNGTETYPDRPRSELTRAEILACVKAGIKEGVEKRGQEEAAPAVEPQPESVSDREPASC